jgi:basic membrane protein A and related proteins
LTTSIDDFLASDFSRRSFLKQSGAAILIGATASLLPSAAFAQAGLVALVHTQAAGDNGPIDLMIAELKKMSAEHGFETRIIYAADPATYETTFRTLGDAGAGIVITTFNAVGETLKVVGPAFPDTKWIQIYGDPIDPPLPNVVTTSYDYYIGCYLSGVFAGHISASGKIGYIGGISIPPQNADYNALKAGALSVNPAATVTGAFAGSFQDPAKGQEIATQMYGDGIDYIQTDSGATDNGIIAAANEGENRFVSGGYPTQYPMGPKSVLGIVTADFGAALHNELAKALDGSFAGGHYNIGIGTGVVDFVLSPTWLEQGPPELVAKAKEVWPAVEAVRQSIIDGTLKVPFNTEM